MEIKESYDFCLLRRHAQGDRRRLTNMLAIRTAYDGVTANIIAGDITFGHEIRGTETVTRLWDAHLEVYSLQDGSISMSHSIPLSYLQYNTWVDKGEDGALSHNIGDDILRVIGNEYDLHTIAYKYAQAFALFMETMICNPNEYESVIHRLNNHVRRIGVELYYPRKPKNTSTLKRYLGDWLPRGNSRNVTSSILTNYDAYTAKLVENTYQCIQYECTFGINERLTINSKDGTYDVRKLPGVTKADNLD